MRIFVVLSVIAAATAAQLGYNYQAGGQAGEGISFASGGIDGGSFGFGNSIAGGSLGGGIGGGGIGGGSFGGHSAPSYESDYNKEFYTFSAPEHDFEDNHAAQEIANSIKKNLRVIFIKGPENKGLENAALNLAKHASDQRTAIYVLNKQSDIGDLANKLNSIRGQSQHKPEVHFVKYRTPEDAANAQHAIQSQYNELGGTSSNHDGGVAPVLNFASPAQVYRAPVQAPGSSYLPSSIFRRRV